MIIDRLLLSMLLDRIVLLSPEIICIFHAVVCCCFFFWGGVVFVFVLFCFGVFLLLGFVWVFFFLGGGLGGYLFVFSLWGFLFVCAFCSYVIIAPMINNLFMYPVCLCLKSCTRFVLALFVRMLSLCFSFVLVFMVV